MAEVRFDDLVPPSAVVGQDAPKPTGVSFDDLTAPEPAQDQAMLNPAAFNAGVPEPPVAMMSGAGVDFDDLTAPPPQAEAPRPTPTLDKINKAQGLSDAERAIIDGQSGRLDAPKEFDAQGSGYDNESARKAGITADETGHFPSLAPLSTQDAQAQGLPSGSGLVLKGRNHPTFHKTLEAEARLGNEVIERNGRFYSVPKGSQQPRTQSFDEVVRAVQEQLRTLPENDPRRPALQKKFDSIIKLKETEREAGAELGKAQAVEEFAAPVQRQLEATAGGLSFGVSDVIFDKLRKASGIGELGGAESTPEQLANSLGRMLGGVFTAQGLAQGMSGLTKQLGMTGLKQVLVTRLGTAGIASVTNALSGLTTGKRTGKEAAADIAQNMAASMLGLGAEQAIPPGVLNWVGQVGTDLVFDIITDVGMRDRLKDQSFKDWFIKEELPQLFMSVAFATKDNAGKGARADLAKQQAQVRQEIKDKFSGRVKSAEESGEIKGPRSEDLVKDIEKMTPFADDAPKTPEADLEAQLTGKLEEGKVGQEEAVSKDNLRSLGYQEVFKLAKDMGVVTKDSTPTEKKLGNMLDGIMAGEFGQRLRDSNLAIPSDKKAIRELATQVALERDALTETRSREQADTEARAQIEADGGAEASLAKMSTGDIGEQDTGVSKVRQVLSDQGISDKFLAGDVGTIDKVQKTLQAHYARGTDIAREMANRADTWESPAGRRSLLVETLLGGRKSDQPRAEQLRRQQKAKEIIESLKNDEGIDLTKIPDDALLNNKYYFDLLTKIGPKTASFRQKFMEFRRFALLSGLKTHVVNIAGNSMRSFHEFTGQRAVELALSAGANKRAKADFAKTDKDLADKKIDFKQAEKQKAELAEALPPTVKSTLAAYGGMWKAKGKAVSLFMDALKNDQPITKADIKADPGSFAAIGGPKIPFTKGLTLGKALRFPQRGLNAADQFASELLRGGLTADFATREAQAKGITDVAGIQKSVEQSIANPKSTAAQKADKESLRLTFREKPGMIGSAILNARNQKGAGGAVAEMLFPFVTTPESIVRQGLRATPLGMGGLAKKVIGDVKKGRTVKQAFSSDEAIKRASEQILGIAGTAAVMTLLNDKDELGRPSITGSMPKTATRAERDFRFKNQPPMSIRVGDEWVSYARVEPFATYMTTVVDSVSALKSGLAAAKGKGDAKKAENEFFQAVSGPFRDKTFMKAIGDLMEIGQGGKTFSDFASNQVASFVPNIFRSTARAGQKEFLQRKTRTKQKEGLKGTLKGKAKELATQAVPVKTPFTNNVRVDHWGNPVVVPSLFRGGGKTEKPVIDWLWKLLSPVEVVGANIPMKVDRALLAYNNEDDIEKPYWPSDLSDLKVSGDKNTRMTDDEFEAFARLRGQKAQEFFAQQKLDIKDMDNPTLENIEQIKTTFTDAGKAAKAELFGREIAEFEKAKEAKRRRR